MSGGEIQLALEKLNVLGRVLYIAEIGRRYEKEIIKGGSKKYKEKK